MVVIRLAMWCAVGSCIVAFAFWYFDIGHRPVEKMPWLNDTTYEESLKKFGSPDFVETFLLGNTGGELRIELRNFFPNEKDREKTEIKEARWNYFNHTLVVWYVLKMGEWRVLDTCRFQNGIAF